MNEEERIKEIKARTEATMPEPWEWDKDVLCAPEPYYVVLKPWHDDDTDKTSLCCNLSDRQFIAHSREDIPYLLDLIESLRAQLDWWMETAKTNAALFDESQRREIARGIDHLRGLAKMVDGIEPDRLREIVEAEKDGRLVVLPCKVGDAVWIHALVPCGACPHGADPTKICGQAGCPVHPIPVSFSVRMYDVIGKTVFLTRSEAEAALEKMKEDEE